jgi:hypothetical protein
VPYGFVAELRSQSQAITLGAESDSAVARPPRWLGKVETTGRADRGPDRSNSVGRMGLSKETAAVALLTTTTGSDLRTSPDDGWSWWRTNSTSRNIWKLPNEGSGGRTLGRSRLSHPRTPPPGKLPWPCPVLGHHMDPWAVLREIRTLIGCRPGREQTPGE